MSESVQETLSSDGEVDYVDVETAEPRIEEPPAPKKKPFGLILLAVLVVGVIFFTYRWFSFNASHVTTDDAYVTTDVVPVTARVSGNVSNVLVKENQTVEVGQPLVELDPATFLADLHQAQANLLVAKAAAEGAGVDVSLVSQTGSAQVEQAQGALAQSASDISTAQASVAKAQASVSSAQAALGTTRANALAAHQAIGSKQSTVRQAQQQVAASQALVTSAEAAVKTAQANLASATAAAENAKHEAERAQALANEGAISKSIAEARQTAATTAQAQVDVARQQVASAEAAVSQQRANLAAAKEAVNAAKSGVTQAQAQAQAADQQVAAQQAIIREAGAGVAVAEESVNAARARQSQAAGKLQEANVAPRKVGVSEANRKTAEAKVQQAMAALESAKIALDRTKIKAPVAGTISHKSVEPGQQVSPGQPLMSIVRDEEPWVVANFKETQVAELRKGEPVEVDVDALGGVVLKGHIDSISSGTGATFALLPADNATGNYTRIVQRVPVKIVFEPGQPGLDRLRAGLSATVIVKVHG